MKKFLSLLLSLIMTISAFASVTITAYAAEGAYNTADKARDYTIGTTINGTFAQNDKLDFIKLTLYESGIINFICEGTTSYNLIIYQENNLDEIIESDSIQYNENLGKSYGENSYYLTSGTYYIKVITYNVNSESYTINTTFTSANESFPESIYSNNNIIGKANEISLNTLYNGILAANDETDFYKFTVTSGKHTLYIKSNYHINFQFIHLTEKNFTEIQYFKINKQNMQKIIYLYLYLAEPIALKSANLTEQIYYITLKFPYRIHINLNFLVI